MLLGVLDETGAAEAWQDPAVQESPEMQSVSARQCCPVITVPAPDSVKDTANEVRERATRTKRVHFHSRIHVPDEQSPLAQIASPRQGSVLEAWHLPPLQPLETQSALTRQ